MPARYPELELVLHGGVVFPTEGDYTLAAAGPPGDQFPDDDGSMSTTIVTPAVH